MRLSYNLVMRLALPLILLRLWLKSFKLNAYRQRWSERLALKQDPLKKVDILIHAVSLGEVIAATPLINALLQKGYQLLITTTTPTGSERVIKNFSNKVAHCYLPFDISGFMHRFLKAISPKLVIIMETELWPNFLYHCQKKSIPVIIANARMSPRNLKPITIKTLRFIKIWGKNLVPSVASMKNSAKIY